MSNNNRKSEKTDDDNTLRRSARHNKKRKREDADNDMGSPVSTGVTLRSRSKRSKMEDASDNEDGSVKDHQGYHKALYTARNADTIARHFYEQGKADATKDIAAKSKNISNEPRTTSSGEVYLNGLRVKAISGADTSKLKIKKK